MVHRSNLLSVVANEFTRARANAGAQALIVAGCILAALALGILIPRELISPKILVALAGGVVMLLLLVRGNVATWGTLYLLAVASFALGYRSVYIGSSSFVV